MKLQDLYTDASTWTQGMLARNKRGSSIAIDNLPLHPEAHSFCLLGGLMKIHSLEEYPSKCPNHHPLYQDAIKLEQSIKTLFPSLYRTTNLDWVIADFNNHESVDFEKIRQVIEHAGV